MDDGTEVAVSYTTVDIRSLNFGEDSSFQNTCEFLAGFVAVIGMLKMGYIQEPMIMRGVSASALSWTEKGVTKSGLATRAGVVWADLLTQFDLKIVDSVYILAERNQREDCLSRNGLWEEVLNLTWWKFDI